MKPHPRVISLAVVTILAVLAGGAGVAAADDGTRSSRDEIITYEGAGGIFDSIFPTAAPSSTSAATGGAAPASGGAPASPGQETSPGATPGATPGAGYPTVFHAANGHDYPTGDLIVPTHEDGGFFFGEEFDTACYDGPDFRRGMDKLDALAQMIEKSGRRVVFTVAPNRTAVDTRQLQGLTIPHGRCARRGIASQKKTLTTYRSPRYVPVLPALRSDHRETYWLGDTHWNTLGATDYAKTLARRLDPRVAASLRYRPTTDHRSGDLLYFAGRTGAALVQTNKGLEPTHRTTERPARGSTDIDPSVVTTTDHRWHTTPAARAMPGRTVLIGDSFTYLGLRSIRPIFRSGHYVWTGVVPSPEIVQSVLDANTVVIEVVQRFVSRSLLIQPAFTRLLRAALAHDRIGTPAGRDRPDGRLPASP